jgi:murein DD-endopeptidase MepM/ murein hydrolase activator NlpD
MPQGTPVVVNGVQIGLSGQSGFVTGAHLHIGRFVNGVDTPPHNGGFVFNNAIVTQIASDPTNGNYVRVQADGASWVYLHLSKQTCKVGQKLIVPKPPLPIPFIRQYYTVVSGDTVTKIAAKYGHSAGWIIYLNPQIQPNPNFITVGQRLRVK